MSENIKEIMGTTLDKIKSIANSDTVIGEPMKLGEFTVVPVSKVSYGFASGGSDFTSKNGGTPNFGGGGGAGMTVAPVAFLVLNNDEVKILHVDVPSSGAENVISMLPDFFEKVKNLFKKDKDDDTKEEKQD